jgi:hypothetical protein
VLTIDKRSKEQGKSEANKSSNLTTGKSIFSTIQLFNFSTEITGLTIARFHGLTEITGFPRVDTTLQEIVRRRLHDCTRYPSWCLFGDGI